MTIRNYAGRELWTGTAAERPTFLSGHSAALYLATDTGRLSLWDGTAWWDYSSGSGGSVVNTTRVTATPYNVLATDDVIFVDTDGGAITVNLPAGVEGTHYKIINCGTSSKAVTVEGDGAEKVYGQLNQTLNDGDVIDLHYNATEGWY